MIDNIFRVVKCRFTKVEKWRTTAVRLHWRIYWNPTSGAKIICGRDIFYLSADHILAIPPGIGVDQILEEPFEHLFIHVAIDFPYHIYPEVVYFKITDDTTALVQKVKTACKSEPAFTDWSVHKKNLVNALIFRVISELDEAKVSGRRFSKTIRKSIDILGKSLVCGVTNQKLSEIAGMSLSAFLAKFKRETGTAPQKYLLNKRLEQAAELLVSTEQSIDHIANSCGFCERSYLSRMFKREYGISPVAFRKSALE